jgi:hypothetical protein
MRVTDGLFISLFIAPMRRKSHVYSKKVEVYKEIFFAIFLLDLLFLSYFCYLLSLFAISGL